MNKEDIRRQIADLSKDQEWNHQYDLGHGIKTRDKDVNSPGYNTLKWERLIPIMESIGLKNKIVLDVGSSDGFYSIKCAQLGADVVGIEIDELRVKRANFIQSVLEISNVTFLQKNLYDFKNEKFDVILGLGLLHRIPDMLTFLKQASEMSDVLILEYKTFDSDKDEVFDGNKQTKLNKHNTLHAIPTNNFVKNRLKENGYTHFDFFLDSESHLTFKRTICVARREIKEDE